MDIELSELSDSFDDAALLLNTSEEWENLALLNLEFKDFSQLGHCRLPSNRGSRNCENKTHPQSWYQISVWIQKITNFHD